MFNHFSSFFNSFTAGHRGNEILPGPDDSQEVCFFVLTGSLCFVRPNYQNPSNQSHSIPCIRNHTTLRKKMTNIITIATSERRIASLEFRATDLLRSRSDRVVARVEGHMPINGSDLKQSFASYELVCPGSLEYGAAEQWQRTGKDDVKAMSWSTNLPLNPPPQPKRKKVRHVDMESVDRS